MAGNLLRCIKVLCNPVKWRAGHSAIDSQRTREPRRQRRQYYFSNHEVLGLNMGSSLCCRQRRSSNLVNLISISVVHIKRMQVDKQEDLTNGSISPGEASRRRDTHIQKHQIQQVIPSSLFKRSSKTEQNRCCPRSRR